MYVVYGIYIHIYICINVLYMNMLLGYFLISFRMLSQQPELNVLSLTKMSVVSSFFEGFFWVLRGMRGLRGVRGMQGALCVLWLHVYTLYSHKVAVVVAVVVGILR